MKKRVQRLAGLFLAVLLLFSALPASAMAATVTIPEPGWVITIGGVKVYDAQIPQSELRNTSVPGVSFDASSMTVVLNSTRNIHVSAYNPLSGKAGSPLTLNVVVNGVSNGSISTDAAHPLTAAHIAVRGSGKLIGDLDTKNGSIAVSNIELDGDLKAQHGSVTITNAKVKANSIFGELGVNISLGSKGSVVVESQSNAGGIQVGYNAAINYKGNVVLQEGRSALARPRTKWDLKKSANAKTVKKLTMRNNLVTVYPVDPVTGRVDTTKPRQVNVSATHYPYVSMQPKAKSLKFTAGYTWSNGASVTHYATNKIMFPGQKSYVTAVAYPENSADTKVTYASNKKGVATVDKNTGLVTAVATGTAVITAKNAQGRKGKLTVTVGRALESNVNTVTHMEMNREDIKLGKNKSYTLRVEIFPKNATYSKLKWESSDTKVATVTNKGVVKGKAEGNCVITATTAEGRTISCLVRVY